MSLATWAEDPVRPLRRAEYERMVELGMFEGEQVELLDGVVVRMSPHGPLHDATLDEVNLLFVRLFAEHGRIRVQSAFAAGDGSEPEPDVAVVPPADYRTAHPQRAYLIVEIAESSLQRDRKKARIYAESAVTEYWIVNVVDAVIEVRWDPAGSTYAESKIYRKGDVIRPRHFPDLAIAVSDILR